MIQPRIKRLNDSDELSSKKLKNTKVPLFYCAPRPRSGRAPRARHCSVTPPILSHLQPWMQAQAKRTGKRRSEWGQEEEEGSAERNENVTPRFDGKSILWPYFLCRGIALASVMFYACRTSCLQNGKENKARLTSLISNRCLKKVANFNYSTLPFTNRAYHIARQAKPTIASKNYTNE